jgi:hypothetical protein
MKRSGERLDQLLETFEAVSGVIDQIVVWVTDNQVWLGNVLPDSMVIVLFMAVAAYFAIQPQYAL